MLKLPTAANLGSRRLRFFLVATGFFAALVSAVAYWVGTAFVYASGIAWAFFAVSLLGVLKGETATGRTLVAQGLVGQAIALTAGLAGHPWQIDSHMVFFAVMATLIALVDIRPLIFAATTIALHHLMLSLFLPHLVFPSSELLPNLLRTAFHGVVVVAETAVLVIAVLNRRRMEDSIQAQLQDLQSMSEAAEASRSLAQAAAEEAQLRRHDSELVAREAQALRLEAEKTAAQAVEANARALQASEHLAAERAAYAARQESIVQALRAALHTLSDGDLTVRLQHLDDVHYASLRDDFNAAVGRLAEAIGLALRSSVEIAGQIEEINSASENLSARTEKQAHALANTAAAMNELTSSVDSAATMASAAARAASDAEKLARDSTNVVGASIQAMGEIERSSHQIASITSVIDDIAFQTNLLALNAGVEAARAGEAGRGFAVVASEVRDLAQRSSASAREISSLIQASERQVKTGVELVNQMVTTLDGIGRAVENISSRVAEIALSSEEQSRALGEINDSVEQLDHVTQQNVAMFEETTAASRVLTTMAAQLHEAMVLFKTEAAAPTLRKTA